MQDNKLNFTGQNIYVGMDTHKNNWRITLEHDKMALKTLSIDPKPDILYNYLQRNFPGATFHTAYEASYCGYWIHYRLKELGLNSIVVNAADVPTTHKERVQKNDKRDSRKIARGLRNGELVPIHIPTMKTIQDRSLIRTRYTLVKEQRRFKNRVKSLLLFYGIDCPEEFNNSSSSHWSNKYINWLESISFENHTATDSLAVYIKQAKNIRASILEVTKKIRALSITPSYQRNVELLMSIPGIGLLTAMLLLTELEDITRFKSIDHLCSYIGFVPSTNSSGDDDNVGEITPRKHNALRTALVESSWIAIRHDPALLQTYSELSKRMDKNKAIIRIAKKLLNRIRYVVKNNQMYVKAIVK